MLSGYRMVVSGVSVAYPHDRVAGWEGEAATAQNRETESYPISLAQKVKIQDAKVQFLLNSYAFVPSENQKFVRQNHCKLGL